MFGAEVFTPRYGYRPADRSKLWRATYVACLLLVFSYILFDVLDLDGSNFPSLTTLMERTAIVAEVLAAVEIACSPEQVQRLQSVKVLIPDSSGEYARFQVETIHYSSPLEAARFHHYRTGLPRDSITDDLSSPARVAHLWFD